MRNIDLAKYYPEVIKEVREFKQIAEAENPELNDLQEELQNIISDQFIFDATVNGVSRSEKMLKIAPMRSDTLNERKFRLLARYNEDLPYTVRNLQNQLTNLCGRDGYSLSIINNEFTIIVRVALTVKKNEKAVHELLERIVPQNMIIDFSLMYNQHLTLANYTHDQLHEFTHDYLRNEVLDEWQLTRQIII